MDDAAKNFDREMDALRALRDELKLKAHLAKADIKSEWNDLEKKWERVDEELRRATQHVKAPLQSIKADTKQLITELKQGYQNISRHLGSN